MKKYIFWGIVLVVLGLLAGFGVAHLVAQPAPVVEQAPLGDVNNNSTASFNAPVCHGSSGTLICEDWIGGKIGAKTNQASWYNNTGQTQYVDLLDVATNGTASSTFNIYAVATTSPLVPLYDFTAPIATGTNLINGFSFATSSAATTTSSVDKTLGGHTVAIPAATRVNIYLRAGCISATVGLCETATSTRRGFDIFWRLHFHN